MNLSEAQSWLRGERSTINTTWGETSGDAQERAARQDAAMLEQAYWIVRAHHEGLIERVQPTPDPEKVKKALAVWKRHRRNGSMPPIRTLQVLVGAARSWLSGTDTPDEDVETPDRPPRRRLSGGTE